MRTAPPAAAALAPLAAGTHRTRRAPACARVPPCCAHARAQVAIVVMVVNTHKAHTLNKLKLMCVAPVWVKARALLGCCGLSERAARQTTRR